MPQVKVGWRSGAVSPVVSVSKLLDTYSSSAAAYSLRKLSSTYTGSAIRVRRSSDNTEQNIGFDSDGNLDTVALSAFVGSGSGFVTTWYDQSGNSRDAFQTTASNQPLIVSSGLITTNGDKPAIRCASGTGLLINQINLGTTHSMFAVIDWISGNKEYFGSFGNSWAFYQVDGEYKANGAVGRTNASFTTNRFLGTLLRINTQLQYYQNSTTLGSPFTISSNNSFNLSNLIGEDYNWGFAGDQQEAIIYTSNMSSSRTGIESNINSYYSVYPNPTSVWNLLAAAYNADSIGSSSLKTSLYAAYNGESNANDSFGSNNGTAVGGLTYTTGKIGNAFTFNGTNSYVSLPDNSLNLTGDFTISAWVYHTASGGQMIASNYAFTSNTINKGWELGIDIISGTQNRVGFLIAQGPSNTAYTGWEFTTTGLVQNAWNHIVIKRVSGVDTYCWINGVSQAYTLKGTGANITLDPTYHTTNKANIGSFMTLAGVASTFMKNGTKIDSLNVWNKALSTSEITELYNSGNGAQYITDNFYKPTPNDALNTYNGTAQGGLTYGVGKVGTAFQFNGTNAYVGLPNNSFNFTGDFSISVWSNFQGASGTVQALLSNITFNGTNGLGYLLYYYNQDLTFQISNNSGYTLLTYSISSLFYNWNNVVITRKASTGTKIYINGNLVTSNLDTRNPSYAATMTPSIGAANYGPTYGNLVQYYASNGTKLDALNIWQKELTASEITELYNSGNGKQYPN